MKKRAEHAADFQRNSKTYLVTGAVLVSATAVVLLLMGRSVWCDCGTLVPWSGDIWSSHNSQHLGDPYFFSHLLHGVVFCGALWPLARWLSGSVRFGIAVGLECAWEVIENTDMVINRYRESTISLDYYGDSVANSVVDILACIGGYAFSMSVPALVSVAAFALTELILAWWIRDTLILNVIMLVYPLEQIKAWQGGLVE